MLKYIARGIDIVNYYNEIKNKLIDNEVYKQVKDYSKNKNDLSTYYEVGRLYENFENILEKRSVCNYNKLTAEHAA